MQILNAIITNNTTVSPGDQDRVGEQGHEGSMFCIPVQQV